MHTGSPDASAVKVAVDNHIKKTKHINGITSKNHEAYRILAKRTSHSNVVTHIPKSPTSTSGKVRPGGAPFEERTRLELKGENALQILTLIESIQSQRIKEYRHMEDAFQALLRDRDIQKYHEDCAAITVKFATSSSQLNAIGLHVEKSLASKLPSVPAAIKEIQNLEKEKLQVTAQLQVLRLKQRTDSSLDSAVRVQKQRLRQLVDDICEHVEELTLEKYNLTEDPAPSLPDASATSEAATTTTTTVTASTDIVSAIAATSTTDTTATASTTDTTASLTDTTASLTDTTATPSTSGAPKPVVTGGPPPDS